MAERLIMPGEPKAGETGSVGFAMPPTFKFRREVVGAQADRFHGAVVNFVPVGWHVIGYLLFAAVAATLLFAGLATYERVETVRGEIEPDRGIVEIVASRSGMLNALHVSEGQRVAADAVLATVLADDYIAQGQSASNAIEAAISRQVASAAEQAQASRQVSDAERRRALAQRQGIVGDIASLKTQLGFQKDLTASARDSFEQIGPIAERGFISVREITARREALLQRRQQLAQLEQTLGSRRSALAELDRSIIKASSESRSADAQLAGSREQIAQSATAARAARIQALVTPLGGHVSGLTVRRGEPVAANQPLMMIVPEHSVMQAELAVPPGLIGFIHTGQEVRLAIDSFPYERFGTISGRILTVAAAPAMLAKEGGGTMRAYPVVVQLRRQDVSAYGSRRALIPGMTLTARIVTDRKNLYEWMLEPIFAVRRR